MCRLDITMFWKALFLLICVSSILIAKAKLHRYRRIINGQPIPSDTRHPANVSLKRWDKDERGFQHFCGGIIIHVTWVLTAAHCFPRGKLPIPLKLQIDSDDRYHVEQLIRYPHQERTKTSVDLALLRTREKINGVVAELPPPGYIPKGKCQVCGLGTLNPKKYVFPRTMQCAMVPIVERKACQEALGPYITIRAGTLCAGSEEADACMGDSGSALHCQAEYEDKMVLAGVVSWGRSCAVIGQPGIYTDVATYRDWLLQTMTKSQNGTASDNITNKEENVQTRVHILHSNSI